jgi:hypothetical protein
LNGKHGSKFRLLRKVLAWLYAVTSALSIYGIVRILPIVAGPHFTANLVTNLLTISVLFALPVIYALAFWTNLKGKRSGKIWGILASLIFLILAIWREAMNFLHSDQRHSHYLAFFMTGLLGIVAFLAFDANPTSKELS